MKFLILKNETTNIISSGKLYLMPILVEKWNKNFDVIKYYKVDIIF